MITLYQVLKACTADVERVTLDSPIPADIFLYKGREPQIGISFVYQVFTHVGIHNLIPNSMISAEMYHVRLTDQVARTTTKIGRRLHD